MSIQVSKNITVEDVLNNSERIYQKMGVNLILNKRISSPFRKDRNPSFNFFRDRSNGNNILWKDLATGEAGNVIGYLAKINKISRKEAYKLIITDNPEIHNIVVPKRIIHEVKKEVNNFKCDYREWSKYDIEYWKQFGITEEILSIYFVRPIYRLYHKEQLMWVNSKECPIYEYSLNYRNNKKYYRPLAPKRYKWIGNMGRETIFGFQQLPERVELLIINKSLKDCMTLHSLGHLAIAPASETTIIPEESWLKIKLRSQEQILLFDNDFSGRICSNKYVERFKIKNYEIPVNYEVKDISEFYHKYGREESLQFLQKLLKL